MRIDVMPTRRSLLTGRHEEARSCPPGDALRVGPYRGGVSR
jgi:hypothetical protein